MSLLLLFSGGIFQTPTPPPANLADFSLATATVHGLGGMPDTGSPFGGGTTARGLGGRAGSGDPVSSLPRTRGPSGRTRIR